MRLPHTDRPRIRDQRFAALAFVSSVVTLWLFLAAMPVLADGGPHVMTANNGSLGISADSCAGCHRIHSASSSAGGYLLGNNQSGATNTTYADVSDFCLSCHSADGMGATTAVDIGVQYSSVSGAKPDASTNTGTILGALRAGGFVQARIASNSAQRYRYSADYTTGLDFLAKVPVGASQPVTSAHLAVIGAPAIVSPLGIAWGYGPVALSNPGSVFSGGLECTSCHNPHGNGQYRILNPLPGDGATTGGVAPASPAPVYDAPLPSAGDTRNYTVIQVKGTTGTNSSFLLYAGQVQQGGFSATSGDYLHRYVPWNSSTGGKDAPNGRAVNALVNGVLVPDFNTQITAWCTQCHTRYYSSRDTTDPSGDGIFSYQHTTTQGRTACTTCHVAHGSNAVMNTDPNAGTTYSANQLYPGQTTLPGDKVGDSRLLKFNGRGTCLACHDPTNTIAVGTYQGPTPNPVVP